MTRNALMADDSINALPGWRVERSLTGTLDDCSLIVATYERPKELLELLRTVNAMACRPAEVIVVDGSPGRQTEENLLKWISCDTPSFNLVYARCPAGLTRQRNAGIDISSGQFVFFLDDDCLPEEGYFETVRRVFLEESTGRVGAVCGLVVNEMQKPLPFRWRLRLKLGLVPNAQPCIYYPSGTSGPQNLIPAFSGLRSIDVLSGCAMTFRRTVLNQHRFSEFFSGYSQGEDMEISLRIRSRWKILWCGDARVEHYHAPAGRPASFRKGVMEVRNHYFIWKRYSPDASAGDKLRFWLDVGLLAAVDLGSFCRRPTRSHNLLHAFGLSWAALNCMLAGLRYEEPRPRKQYELRMSESQ